ncbi:putative membrane protein [Burkholderia thailandensis E254]|uniref:hypothetical protein n=1 Tax=Burkholderia thailandensis TaxID=57975 RepID=UPI000517B74A|nr:hypothetical protein [Burkholderia thailandensis]AIT20012.1 putative membrane protein [Burkholderia thailandensis E254]PNE69137.1 hypothetical protein A8H38_24485 [Burkholderia thailandensis]
MKKRTQIVLATAASILCLVGTVFSVGALLSLRSVDQLHRLLSYDYFSFVEGQAASGMATDFFTGIALVLVGSILFTKTQRAGHVDKAVATFLLVFMACTLVYACLNSRIGVRPY